MTAAYLDWKAGMRGVCLYRKHIPGWQKHSRYHRIGEQKALMDAIRADADGSATERHASQIEVPSKHVGTTG